jgi:hypothetical protein
MAYRVACGRRNDLVAEFQAFQEEMESLGKSGALRSFEAIFARATAAINMKIPVLVRFLKTGLWLNIYEFTAWTTGLKGQDLLDEVARRLGLLAGARTKLDTLFRFRRDTHYASLNLGGAGARRYGTCCVVFDLHHWSPFVTCFCGDSIRACFSERGDQVLEDDEILRLFSVEEDAPKLAALRHSEYLGKQDFCVDQAEVRDIIEADDSLVEYHLHGPVRRELIREVRISRSDYRHLRDLMERYDPVRSPKRWEFDKVEPFRDVLALLDRYDIPLVVAEGGE